MSRPLPILGIVVWLAALVPAARVSGEDRQDSELAGEKTAGKLEVVATFDDLMPTGVAVSKSGRVFVCFPRWGDEVKFSVAEIQDGQAHPYPNMEINRLDTAAPAKHFLCVQSVVVDPADRLWILDPASIEMKGTIPGGPKLVAIDLETDEVVKTIPIPEDVAPEMSYLNDVRFDLRRGEGGLAFITDSSSRGPNGIVVVDLASGESWRKLNNHPSTRPEPDFLPIVEGRILMRRPDDGPPSPITIGSDGIAIDPNGRRLYYCPLSGRHLYSVNIDALADRQMSDPEVARTVIDHGSKGASDGLESDSEGRVYLTEYEHNAVLRWSPDGTIETLAHDPRLLWPDTLALGHDGFLYIIANQLHRQATYQGGQDHREKPYALFRVKVDADPVLLKPEGQE